MNIIKLLTFYETYFLSFIFIINCVNNVIIEDNQNDSMSLRNVTDDYHSWTVLMRNRRQIADLERSCRIPNYSNSMYKIISDLETIYKPEDYVIQFSILKIICDEGYNLPPFSPATFSCYNGKWDHLPPACIRTCPSLKSTNSTTVECKYKNETLLLDNCIHPIDGTSVHLSCNTFYESNEIKINPKRLCTQGNWSPDITQCSAVCGWKSPKAKLNIINGNDTTLGDYPWHVGIYNKTKEYLCGGSIIHEKIVLSAAHCFTDNEYKALPVENYLIAAGKYYSKYDDSRDKFVQYSKVQQIMIPEKFKGNDGLNGYDLAALILEDPFKLTIGVLPVCIELNADSRNEDYLQNKYGIVTGWGFDQEDAIRPSTVLKELTVPYIPYDKCYEEVPENFKSFVIFDKICGGFKNKGISICPGDSGGALVDNKNDHYFVIGIVSTSPSTPESGFNQCNSQEYSLYTAVNTHIKWLQTWIIYYGFQQSIFCLPDECTDDETDKRNGCLLPSFPENGKFSLANQNHKYQSGNYVETDSAILLSCDDGYSVNSSRVAYFFSCLENGTWNPALESCTPIETVNLPNELPVAVVSHLKEDLAEGLFHKFDFHLLVIHFLRKNFVISPAGIKIIIAILLEGSKAKSAQEINNVAQATDEGDKNNYFVIINNTLIHLMGDFSVVARYNNLINRTLYELSTKSKNTILNVGSVFALSNKHKMREDYRNILQKYNYARSENVDFSKSAQFTSYLNNLIKSATHGSINKIISAENIQNDASMVIANALFFKARWKFTFTEKVDKFTYYIDIGNTAEQYVKTLEANGQFRCKYFKNFDAQVIELPFNDEQHAMAIFLPSTVDIFAGLHEIVKLDYFQFGYTIDKLTLTDVIIRFPKFDIEFSPNIKEMFGYLGIEEIFSKNADLSGIVEQGGAKIDNIFHKVRVEINEEGELTPTVQSDDPESVIVNRPFLFFIYDIKSKDIIFEGKITSPELLYNL